MNITLSNFFMRFNKYLLIIALSSVFIFGNYSISKAQGLQPFGGMVTAMRTCNSGLLLTVVEPFGVNEYMWFWGNLPYLMYIIPHIGQNMLGMAAYGTVPCVIGTVTIGSGMPIIYHGSSI